MRVQITAGNAPAEACRAVYLCTKWLQKKIQQLKGSFLIIEAENGAYSSTYKSVIIEINGTEAVSFTRTLTGSHLWICQSPFRPKHPRKNWFFQMNLLDEVEEILFNEKDVIFHTMRSGGKGGQNVNKLDTAVRAIHTPTGLSTISQNERSQYRNKVNAIKQLQKMILQKNLLASTETQAENWSKHSQLERGNPKLIFRGKSFTESK